MFGGNDKLNMKQKILGGLFQRVGHFAGGLSYGGFNAGGLLIGGLLAGGLCAGRPFCRVAPKTNKIITHFYLMRTQKHKI